MTQQKKMLIVTATALAGVVLASGLYVASGRTAWPALLLAPAVVWLTVRFLDRY